MPREQFLFHRETNPGSGFANVCFDFTDVLDMPERRKQKTLSRIFKALLNQARPKKGFYQECKIPGKLLEKEMWSP